IHGVFGDMKAYYGMFRRYVWGAPVNTEKDALFHWFMYLSAKIMKANTFFLVCAMLYVIPVYLACKKWFGLYWYYPFLAIVGSFTFWAYGTNGIRNGMASSIFILALSRDRRIWQLVFMLISVSIHKAMIIPFVGYVVTLFFNNTKYFYYFWLLSIVLSLAMPGFWQSFFAGLGAGEESRVSYLTEQVNQEKFSRTGFRWDFLLFSSTGVFAGWYYVLKKRFSDKFYIRLYNIFLFANAFWILVIRANFSNRFAYLSWFLLALVIFYLLLKSVILKDQHKRIGIYLLVYYLLSYIFNVL